MRKTADGNCRENKSKQIVRQVNLIHELICSDRNDCRRNHHDAEDESEESVAELPFVCNESIGRERGEVDSADGCSGGNQEGVLQTDEHIEGLSVKNVPVPNQVGRRNE